jgi:hypothetical protein
MLSKHSEGVTEEMIDGAQMYVDAIMDKCFQSKNIRYGIEQKVNISTIHPDCWGTPDFWHYDAETHTLHIFDYKFGHGYVDVFENWQLLEYAAGIVTLLGVDTQYILISYTIVQPRNYHKDGPVREWVVLGEKNWAYWDKLRDAETDAMAPDAPCIPTDECTYCSARHVCSALQAATSEIVTAQCAPPNIVTLSPELLGQELRTLRKAATLLEARISGLEAEAISHLNSGKRVPYFTLEPARGREGWNTSAESISTLGKMYGVELLKPATPITPNQAIKAGIPESIVKRYVKPGATSFKLVMDDGKKSRRVFA